MSFDFGGFAGGVINAASKGRIGQQYGEETKREMALAQAQQDRENLRKAFQLHIDQQNASAHSESARAATTTAERPRAWEPMTKEEKLQEVRDEAEARAKAASGAMSSSTSRTDAERAARVEAWYQKFLKKGIPPDQAHTKANKWVRESLAMSDPPDIAAQMAAILLSAQQQGAAAPAPQQPTPP